MGPRAYAQLPPAADASPSVLYDATHMRRLRVRVGALVEIVEAEAQRPDRDPSGSAQTVQLCRERPKAKQQHCAYTHSAVTGSWRARKIQVQEQKRRRSGRG